MRVPLVSVAKGLLMLEVMLERPLCYLTPSRRHNLITAFFVPKTALADHIGSFSRPLLTAGGTGGQIILRSFLAGNHFSLKAERLKSFTAFFIPKTALAGHVFAKGRPRFRQIKE